MTDEETGRIYDRAGSLRVQIQTMAREMFGHLALLGVPEIGVLLLPDGEHSPIDLLRARESAERQLNRLGEEIGELQAEIRTRQKQLAYVSGQKTPIELESLSDAEAACCAQIVSGAFSLANRAPGRLIVIDPKNGALFFAGAPAGELQC